MVNTQLIPIYKNGRLLGIETDTGVIEGEALEKYLERNPAIGGFYLRVPTVESTVSFGEHDYNE